MTAATALAATEPASVLRRPAGAAGEKARRPGRYAQATKSLPVLRRTGATGGKPARRPGRRAQAAKGLPLLCVRSSTTGDEALQTGCRMRPAQSLRGGHTGVRRSNTSSLCFVCDQAVIYCWGLLGGCAIPSRAHSYQRIDFREIRFSSIQLRVFDHNSQPLRRRLDLKIRRT